MCAHEGSTLSSDINSLTWLHNDKQSEWHVMGELLIAKATTRAHNSQLYADKAQWKTGPEARTLASSETTEKTSYGIPKILGFATTAV